MQGSGMFLKYLLMHEVTLLTYKCKNVHSKHYLLLAMVICIHKIIRTQNIETEDGL